MLAPGFAGTPAWATLAPTIKAVNCEMCIQSAAPRRRAGAPCYSVRAGKSETPAGRGADDTQAQGQRHDRRFAVMAPNCRVDPVHRAETRSVRLGCTHIGRGRIHGAFDDGSVASVEHVYSGLREMMLTNAIEPKKLRASTRRRASSRIPFAKDGPITPSSTSVSAPLSMIVRK